MTSGVAAFPFEQLGCGCLPDALRGRLSNLHHYLGACVSLTGHAAKSYGFDMALSGTKQIWFVYTVPRGPNFDFRMLGNKLRQSIGEQYISGEGRYVFRPQDAEGLWKILAGRTGPFEPADVASLELDAQLWLAYSARFDDDIATYHASRDRSPFDHEHSDLPKRANVPRMQDGLITIIIDEVIVPGFGLTASANSLVCRAFSASQVLADLTGQSRDTIQAMYCLYPDGHGRPSDGDAGEDPGGSPCSRAWSPGTGWSVAICAAIRSSSSRSAK